MFSLVTLLKVQVVISKEVVVVLRANSVPMHLPTHLFVRLEESRPVLPQLVVVVLVVEELRSEVAALSHRVTVLVYYPLEPCLSVRMG